MQVYQILTMDQVQHSFDPDYASYTVWARVAGREDVAIWQTDSVRERDGALQVNAGTFNLTRREYEADEWLDPVLVFAVHQCEGCQYPPSLCCLQGISDDAIDSAEDRLFGLEPNLPTINIEK